MKLLLNAGAKFSAGVFFVAVLLFGPAGTLRYPNAWKFMALLFLPMLVLGVVLFWKAPALLEKRLNNRERESGQKGVVALAALVFLAAFIAAGLDFRFGWTCVPRWLNNAACLLMPASYALYMEVMRENVWLSRTVEVQQGQKVVDTGLYGIIRHPMYTATILLFLSMPLVLGSWISFALLLLYPAVIVLRIHGEEQVLHQGLEGYTEYTKRVRYRLIPFLW